METEKLVQYTADRLRLGIPKASLSEELLALGWSEEEIEAAYRSAVMSLGAPIPAAAERPLLARKAGAVEVIINGFAFILLGIVATALGALYFQIINHFFPDPLDSAYGYARGFSSDAVHYATAALLISFPLYAAALWLWFRKFRSDEGRREALLSRWLTYGVLLIAAIVIVGDLITLVYAFLQGEITVRFFLKALIIFGIAGGIFGFYTLERRKIQYRVDLSRAIFQRFGIVVGSVVALGIILGFIASGSPLAERQRSFDDTRSEHLSTLASCIEQYASTYQQLPETLDNLRQSNEFSYCLSVMNDPETGIAYAYRIISPRQVDAAVAVGEYELCAIFSLASTASHSQSMNSYGIQQGIWYEHEAGKSCHQVRAKLGSLAPAAQPIPTQPQAVIRSQAE